MMVYNPNQVVTMGYTNWKGEYAIRKVVPTGRMYFKSTQFHPQVQWIMEAWDVEKDAMREFALEDCDFTVKKLAGEG